MKLLYSFILLLTGSCLAYWIKKRRFNRINRYGVEEFKSFGDKVFAGFIEKVLWWLALFCILVGAILAL
jgi:hypothetical protein